MGELSSGPDPELPVDMAKVVLHGRRTYEHLGGDVLIGSGQREMGFPPVFWKSHVVNGGPYKWVAENNTVAEIDQSLVLDVLRRLFRDPKPVSGTPDDPGVSCWVRCRHQQKPPAGQREFGQPSTVALLDRTGQGDRYRQPNPACKLRGCQTSWQL